MVDCSTRRPKLGRRLGILWRMTLPQTQIALPEWIAAQEPSEWLTPSEHTVFDGWRSEKRRTEWLAGRLAAKRLVHAEFGLEPSEWAIGRDGIAPSMDAGGRLTEYVLSLSHSGGAGAATVSHRQSEGGAGIDLQQIRPVHPGLCTRAFTQNERQQIAAQFGAEDDPAGMLLLWALKEAAIKARRQPWGRPLQSIEVRLGDPGLADISMEGEPTLTAQYARQSDWWLARAVALIDRNSSYGSRL